MGVLNPHGEDRSHKRCIASLVLFLLGSVGLVGGLKCVIYWLKVDFIPEWARKKKKKKKNRRRGWLLWHQVKLSQTEIAGGPRSLRLCLCRKTQLSNPKWIIVFLFFFFTSALSLIHVPARIFSRYQNYCPKGKTTLCRYKNGALFTSHGWIMAAGWQGYLSAGFLIKQNGILQCGEQKAADTLQANSRLLKHLP